jgi:hypothetical protein
MGFESPQSDDGRTYRQVGNVQIPGRRLQITMPHQNLDAAQIGRLFQQMSGEAVPQGMGGYGLRKLRGFACLPADGEDRLAGDRALRDLAWEEPERRSVTSPIDAEQLEQLRREHHLTIFVALALTDTDDLSLTVISVTWRLVRSETRKPAA